MTTFLFKVKTQCKLCGLLNGKLCLTLVVSAFNIRDSQKGPEIADLANSKACVNNNNTALCHQQKMKCSISKLWH